MYDKSTKFLLFLFLTVVFETPCLGAFTSNYGQITNVQAYSSNPYYNQNGMYNQGFPRPVYAQGTDLGSGDCENIITAVIADYCSTRNKCNGLRLSDVRPGIMVALSQMPNHNYITSCYGFLDGAFDKYIESNPQSVQRVNQNINVPQLPKESFPQVPKWKQEYDERSRELENLQKQNDDNNGDLTQTDFPKGIADVSFQERIKNTAEDMQNYKDMKAYYGIEVVQKTQQGNNQETQQKETQQKETQQKETPEDTEDTTEEQNTSGNLSCDTSTTDYNKTLFERVQVQNKDVATKLIREYIENTTEKRFDSCGVFKPHTTWYQLGIYDYYEIVCRYYTFAEGKKDCYVTTYKFDDGDEGKPETERDSVLRFICENITKGSYSETDGVASCTGGTNDNFTTDIITRILGNLTITSSRDNKSWSVIK